MTNPARLRKRLLETEATASAGTDNEINIVGCATIAFSSESTVHPIEHLFDGHSGPGATRWISACPDMVEELDSPVAGVPNKGDCVDMEEIFKRGILTRTSLRLEAAAAAGVAALGGVWILYIPVVSLIRELGKFFCWRKLANCR